MVVTFSKLLKQLQSGWNSSMTSELFLVPVLNLNLAHLLEIYSSYWILRACFRTKSFTSSLANGNIRPIRTQRKYSSIPEVIKLWWRIQDSKGRSFYWACIIYKSIKYGHHKNSSEYPSPRVIGLNKANSLGQPLTKLWPYRTCPLPVVDYHST